MFFIKGVVFFFLLLYASYSDVKSREISSWIPVSIAITGLIGVKISDLPLMILSAAIVSVPQIIFAIRKKGGYGGGDIKLMTACAFLLGLEGGLAAIIIGLTVGLITIVIKRKLKKESLQAKFPIVPFLAFGSFITFLLI